MLNHPTLDRLRVNWALTAWQRGSAISRPIPESRALEHAEWLGLLVDQEVTFRRQKRFEARTRTARLRQAATAEDVDFRKPRGLDSDTVPASGQLRLGPRAPATASSPALAAPARASSPAHWAIGLAGRKPRQSSISAARACSAPWRWHAATAVMPG